MNQKIVISNMIILEGVSSHTVCMFMRYPIFSPDSFGDSKPYFTSIAVFSRTLAILDTATPYFDLRKKAHTYVNIYSLTSYKYNFCWATCKNHRLTWYHWYRYLFLYSCPHDTFPYFGTPLFQHKNLLTKL